MDITERGRVVVSGLTEQGRVIVATILTENGLHVPTAGGGLVLTAVQDGTHIDLTWS